MMSTWSTQHTNVWIKIKQHNSLLSLISGFSSWFFVTHRYFRHTKAKNYTSEWFLWYSISCFYSTMSLYIDEGSLFKNVKQINIYEQSMTTNDKTSDVCQTHQNQKITQNWSHFYSSFFSTFECGECNNYFATEVSVCVTQPTKHKETQRRDPI